MIDISGMKHWPLVALWDADTNSMKTLQPCLPLTEDEHSELYSARWPKAGILVSGRVYGPAILERHTEEIECGLWPTPTARDWKDGRFCPNVAVNALLGREVWYRDSLTPPSRETGQLNPDWVEQYLFQFPKGWTVYDPSETPSFPKSPNGLDTD